MNTPHPPLAVFLRGINVNGVRIAMADLQACLSAAGYRDVTTVLATGNVVCRPPVARDSAAHKADIERCLSERFRYPATIHLRTAAQLTALCDVAATLSVTADAHCYALLCHDSATVTALATAYAALPADPAQQCVVAADDLLWIVPKGQTLTAPFGKLVLGNKRYTVLVTSRTIETVKKTLQIATRLSH